MIVMAMRGYDAAKCVAAYKIEDPVAFGCSIDQELFARSSAAQQIDVVVHGANRKLVDDHRRQFAVECGTAYAGVTGIHVWHPSDRCPRE